MKNEAPFILEWVAHYKSLGFDNLVVCSNDCEDGTAEMLLALARRGLVRHHFTTIWPRAGIQRSALKQAAALREVTQAEWVFVCDADEFLTIHIGDGSVRALTAALPQADVIEIPWRIFGAGGILHFADQPVTEQFLMAEDPADTRRLARKFCKSLTRQTTRFSRLGIHAPIPAPDWADRITRLYPNGSPTGPTATHRHLRCYAVAQVNHYAVRSRDSYLVKRARGRVNHTDTEMGLKYFRNHNINQVTDAAVRRYAAATAAWRAQLLADPLLRDLHEAAVAWHHAKIAAIHSDPAMAPLITAITRNCRRRASGEQG